MRWGAPSRGRVRGRRTTSRPCVSRLTMGEAAHTTGSGLVDLIDRLLDAGAVVAGQVTVTLADIDLIDLDLRVLLTSVEASRRRAGLGPRTAPHRAARPLPPMRAPASLPDRLEAGARGEDGVARLGAGGGGGV